MEKNAEKKNFFDTKGIYIILAVIIFFQAGLVTWRFIFEKEGFHSDEIWTYGFANYFDRPESNPVYYATIGIDDNFNKWLDGDIFRDFMTTQDDERFSYGDVWYTQVYDNHPPLYYAVVHAICSFFPNHFSWWFAYFINIVAMIIGQIFFYKAASEICRSKALGLLAIIMWGFSYGFTNLNIFLRMYSMLVMLSVMFIYYHACLYYNKGIARDNLIKLGIVTLCGALTHHFFLPAAFGIAASFCFFYLFKKQFKMLFSYAASVGGATFLSFVFFPPAFNHMFSSLFSAVEVESEMSEMYETPFINAFRFCISNLLNSISGISISVYERGTYAFFVAAFVILALIAIPLSFLLRKEEWFKAFMKKVKNTVMYFFKNFDFMFLFLLVGCVILISAVSKTVNIHLMRGHTDRYLSVIAPWIVLCMILTAKYILQIIRPLKKYSTAIIAVLVCASILVSNILTERRYIFERNLNGEGRIETTVSDSSNYILLIAYKWHLVLFPDKLIGCDKAFPSLFYQYDFYKDEISKINPESCYVIMDSTVMKNYYDTYETLENLENSEDDTTVRNEYSKEITSIEEIFRDFETNIFPGYKLQFYSSELIMGSLMKTYKLVPESEYVYIEGGDDSIS